MLLKLKIESFLILAQLLELTGSEHFDSERAGRLFNELPNMKELFDTLQLQVTGLYIREITAQAAEMEKAGHSDAAQQYRRSNTRPLIDTTRRAVNYQLKSF